MCQSHTGTCENKLFMKTFKKNKDCCENKNEYLSSSVFVGFIKHKINDTIKKKRKSKIQLGLVMKVKKPNSSSNVIHVEKKRHK